jgi:hypothetical protein
MSQPALLVLACALALPLAAQEHSEHAAPGQSAQPAQPAEQPGQQSHDMHARMQAMHEQMARIHATQDAEERERLMHEHMQAMHESMGMMARMGQEPGNQGSSGQSRCAQGDMPCRLQEMQRQHGMLQQRMGAMQGLMEQMMEHLREAESDNRRERRR